jgi:hypothetical protein
VVEKKFSLRKQAPSTEQGAESTAAKLKTVSILIVYSDCHRVQSEGVSAHIYA